MARNLFFCQINPNYAIHCSAFTINNGRANVRQWLRQAFQPSAEMRCLFPQRFAFALPPFEGGDGGMFLCVRDTVYPA